MRFQQLLQHLRHSLKRGHRARLSPSRGRRLQLESLEDRYVLSPLYTVPLHGIRVTDDDGGRAANITPAQVKQWVDKANEIYFTAGIQLAFDPNIPSALSTLHNTTVNNLTNDGSSHTLAHNVAATYPGQLVVFFRHGEGANPTGNGFSDANLNFVAMPGFPDTAVITGKDAAGQWIWKQNIWLLAHETGHYLGLEHPFPGNSDDLTDTPAKALQYIIAHGGTPAALDGDGLADTPPEAGKAFYINQGWDPCVGHDSYMIGPFTFTPNRHIIMSYFACDRMMVSPMEANVMRQTVVSRGVGMTPGVLAIYGDPGTVNDVITIARVGSDVKVTVNSLMVQVSLSSVSAITVDGRDGYDVLNLNLDTDNPSNVTYNITATTVARTGLPTISYTNIEDLEIKTGSAGTIVANVASTHLNTLTTVDGARTVNVGNGGLLSAIAGLLVVKNTPDFTNLTVNDSADSTPHTGILDTVTVGGANYGRISGLAPVPIEYKYGDTFGATVMTGTGGGTTVNVLATVKPVALIGHATGTVNIGTAGSVQQINGPLTIADPGAGNYVTVNVDDSADGSPHTVTLDTVSIGGFNYGHISGLAPATIDYKYTDTGNVTVRTGTGAGTTVNVKATGVPVNLIGHANGTVNVGNAGSVQQINASLTIADPPLSATVTVNVDDHADATPRTVTLDTVSIGGLNYGRISGLAPAPIQYNYTDTAGVTVQTGVGGATVNVKATGKPVSLIGNANGTVNVGNAGSVQQINAALTITDPPLSAHVTVNVDDSADTTPRTVTLDTVNATTFGRIAGLAPATIDYRYTDTNTMTVRTGAGGATVNVKSTGKPVNLIGNATGTVNVGNAGSVQQINGLLTITDPPGGAYVTVNVDDSADTTARTVTLDVSGNLGTITGLAPAAINYATSDAAAITLNGGSGGNIFNVLGLAGAQASVRLNTGAGNDAVNVGSAAGTLDSIQAPLTINGQGGSNILTINDQGSAGQTYVLDSNTVNRGGAATIAYGAVQGLTVNCANASIVEVVATNAGTPVTLNSAGSMDLFASDAANTWNLTGLNSGTLSSPLIAGTVTFNGTQSLHGGADIDNFIFADGGAVDLSIDGGAGLNTLDYSAYTSSAIVNLQLGTATGVGNGIFNIQNVTGGNGGPAGAYNLLVGNGGNILTGGNGRRNLMIAGASSSTLIGGNDEDLLIGGTTAYDTDVGQLAAIVAEWVRTDEDYDTRVTNLTTGAGVPLLDATTVTGNGGGNTLTGNDGRDLFFANVALDTTDWDPATETLIGL